MVAYAKFVLMKLNLREVRTLLPTLFSDKGSKIKHAIPGKYIFTISKWPN
jgi:hypothetical protein